MRIFRLRTLAGANVTRSCSGRRVFSQFFLLTLYMQQVLHYSAIETGVAYLALTLTIIVSRERRPERSSTRFGVRRVLPVGLALAAAALVLSRSCRLDGHYFCDLFPRVPAQRARARVHVRPDDDRGADGRASRPTPASPPA